MTGVRGSGPDGDSPAAVAALLPETVNWEFAQTEEQLAAFDSELGWSIVDTGWFVEYLAAPQRFSLLGGEFDEQDLTAAMGQPEDGIWSVGDDQAEPTAARQLGEPLWSALDDGRLYVGQQAEPVADALAGPAQTLADSETLKALAGAMDAADAHAAMLLADGDFSYRSSLPLTGSPEQSSSIEAELLPHPFTGVGAGVTQADDAAVVVFAYYHDDAVRLRRTPTPSGLFWSKARPSSSASNGRPFSPSTTSEPTTKLLSLDSRWRENKVAQPWPTASSPDATASSSIDEQRGVAPVSLTR